MRNFPKRRMVQWRSAGSVVASNGLVEGFLAKLDAVHIRIYSCIWKMFVHFIRKAKVGGACMWLIACSAYALLIARPRNRSEFHYYIITEVFEILLLFLARTRNIALKRNRKYQILFEV